jgi:hypothetical protein
MNSHALTANQTLSASGTEPATLAGTATFAGGTSVTVAFGGTLSKSVGITTAAGHNASVNISAESIDGNLRVTTKDGFGFSANIELRELTVKGSIALTSGIGATTLRANQLDVLKTFSASLGSGANRFLIEQENQTGSSVFRDAVVLKGGSGVDTFLIGGTGNNAVQFLATVIANGSTGTDTLTEGEASTHPEGKPLVKVSIP